MLKIKKDRIKDLEKFGMKYYPEQRNQYEHYNYESRGDFGEHQLHLIVWCNNREIKAFDRKGDDLLYDLIKADMVEKVVEDDD